MQTEQTNRRHDPIPGFNSENPMATLISEFIKTREIRALIATAAPEVLNAWAGENPAKKTTTRLIGNSLKKGLLKPSKGAEHQKLSELFENPDHVKLLAKEIPKMVGQVLDVAHELGNGIAALPPSDKNEVVGQLIQGLFSGRTGGVITAWARALSSMERDAPGTLSALLRPGIFRWVETTDFGEIKEWVTTLSKVSEQTVKDVNDALWMYPAKVVVLVSLLPDLANAMGKVVNESVGRFNQLPPDLVADVILSCLRELDAGTLAGTVNGMTELIRQIDTGSSLIGDSGVSGFNREIASFINTFVAALDVEKVFRAKEGIAAGKETLAHAVLNQVEAHPELMLGAITRAHLSLNPRLKTTRRKAEIMTDMPGDEALDALTTSVSRIELNDIAETVNLISGLFNRLRGQREQVVADVVSQVVDSLDLDEVGAAATGMIHDLKDSLRPLGKIVLPHLIHLAGDWLAEDESDGDRNGEKLKEAVYSVLQPGEGHAS